MKALGLSKWIAASVIAVAAASGAMAAEKNVVLARDGLPPKYFKRVKEYEKALNKLDDSEQSKGIYRNSSLWGPNYPKLRVCFFEGSQALREVVANVAKEWMTEDNSIRLDFGKPGKRRTCQPGKGNEMQIRVSFSQEGYWSQVGQNSVVFVEQKDPSLNLGGFMNVTPDQLSDYEIGTIRHEFGHAIGIEHEHQNPKGGCDNEYNWQQIYQYLEGPPNNWTKSSSPVSAAAFASRCRRSATPWASSTPSRPRMSASFRTRISPRRCNAFPASSSAGTSAKASASTCAA